MPVRRSRKGRFILSVSQQTPGTVLERVRLGGVPRESARLVLREDEYPVRVARRGPFLLIRSDRPITFVPPEDAHLAGAPVALIAALDGVDASGRAHIARRLAGLRTDDPDTMARAAYDSLPATETGGSGGPTSGSPPGAAPGRDEGGGAPPALSPAARALRDELRAGGAPHLTPLRKRGLAPAVDELVRAEYLFVLERGHVIESRAYRRLAAALPGRRDSFGSRDAAARWGCTHGRARAILGRMVADGLLRREDGSYLVNDDDAEDPT
ncbi:MAG: hypothetical protein ACOC0E_04910 [Spirochaetota bacterium]